MVSPDDTFVCVRVPEAKLVQWERSCDRGDTETRRHTANMVLTYGKRIAGYDELRAQVAALTEELTALRTTTRCPDGNPHDYLACIHCGESAPAVLGE